MPVTVSMMVACQLMVLHTCVCLALPMRPVRSRSMPFHQSQKPVIAAPSDTTPPATIT